MDCAPSMTTARLFLRPVELGDAPATSALMTPTIAADLMTWPGQMSVTDARQRIARSRREAATGRWVNWAVFTKQDLILIGWAGLGRSDLDPKRLVAGHWIGDAFQRHGFGTEAVGAVLSRSGDVFGGGDIDAYVRAGNVPGARLLRRLGFTEGGSQRRYVDARVRWEDFVHFALPRDAVGATGDWPDTIRAFSAGRVASAARPDLRQVQ